LNIQLIYALPRHTAIHANTQT